MQAIEHVRLTDTRQWRSAVRKGEQLAVPAAKNRPAWAGAAVVNITIVDPSAGFHLKWSGASNTSLVNNDLSGPYANANLAVVPLDNLGRVVLRAGGQPNAEAHVVVDQQGWAQ